MAANTPKQYSGVIEDHTKVNSTPAAQCVIIKGPKYTLQTPDGAWVITDETLAAKYAGKRVHITGTISDGNKLKVISIAPAN